MGIPADPVTYEALVEAAATAGDWRSAETVVREVLASSVGIDSEDSSDDAAGASKSTSGAVSDEQHGAVSERERLARPGVSNEARGQGAITAVAGGTDVTTTASATAGVVVDADAFAAPQDWAEKRKRWRRQQLAAGIQPTPQLFQLLLEAYSRAGEWDRALECIDGMWSSTQGGMSAEDEDGIGAQAGFPPDATSFGWAMQVRKHSRKHCHAPMISFLCVHPYT